MNQFLIIFAIVVLTPQAILATLETTRGSLLYSYPRTTHTSRTARASDDNPLQCPPGVMGPVCSSDCRTILTCVSGNLISSSKCADTSSIYQYCVPNTFGCTDTPDLSYESCVGRPPTVEFTCTSEGYFPNPHDCTEYYFCTTDSVYKYACPPNYVYDSHSNICRFEYICSTIDCTMTPNKYVAHPGNQAFYAFCSYDAGNVDVIMFRCNHFDTHIFNPDNIYCEFHCRSEGWFGHETNKSDFYECYYSEGVLVHRIQSCPVNYVFDRVTKQCVAGEQTTTQETTIP